MNVLLLLLLCKAYVRKLIRLIGPFHRLCKIRGKIIQWHFEDRHLAELHFNVESTHSLPILPMANKELMGSTFSPLLSSLLLYLCRQLFHSSTCPQGLFIRRHISEKCSKFSFLNAPRIPMLLTNCSTQFRP